MKNVVNSTPQNLKNIEALAIHIDANMRLAQKHKRVCQQMLEQYLKEEYHIVLDESVIALEDETKGTFYFAPDVVNFEVEEDDGMKIILEGSQFFPGDKMAYFVSIPLDENMKKLFIYRVEDLPLLLEKE